MIKLHQSWNGRIPYSRGLKLMAEAEARARELGRYTVLGFEFEPVITLGLRGRAQDDVLLGSRELGHSGIEVVKVDRGGVATLHSPGQLVIYPVVDIRKLGVGAREFVSLLERTTREVLESYGVTAFPGPCESGVFTLQGKIAFVGLRIRAGIATHGLAINVNNDLGLFHSIRSCGQAERPHDRMAEWRANVEISEVYRRWCARFLSSLLLTTEAQHGLHNAPNIGL